MDIMEQIKDEMKRQNISGTRMALRLGLTPPAVYKWLSGESDPNYSHLLDMAWVLGCEIKLEKEINDGIPQQTIFEREV